MILEKNVDSHTLERYWMDMGRHLPRLKCVIKNSRHLEAYEILYDGGEIELRAANVRSAEYALHLIQRACRSGHLGDFLGSHIPNSSLRPLYLIGDVTVNFSSRASLCFPLRLLSSLEERSSFVERLIQLGYNAVVFGADEKLSGVEEVDLLPLLQTFKCYGIGVILQPVPREDDIVCPFDPKYQTYLEELFLPFQKLPIRGVFWKSQINHPNYYIRKYAPNALYRDLLLKEVSVIEAITAPTQHLYMYIPQNDYISLDHFADDVSGRTRIVFNQLVGEPRESFRPFHRLWEQQRQVIHVGATPFLPIVNVGNLDMGEGLWPLIPLDLFDHCFRNMRRHCFEGILSMTRHVPASETLLDCNLWVVAQMQWTSLSPHKLVETWFGSEYPGLHWSFLAKSFQEMWQIALEVQSLKYQGAPVEQTRQKLKTLQHKISAGQMDVKVGDLPIDLKAMFNAFFRDAKRLLFVQSQRFNIPIANILGGEELKEGFWTEVSELNTKSIMGSAQIKVNEKSPLARVEPVLDKILKAVTRSSP